MKTKKETMKHIKTMPYTVLLAMVFMLCIVSCNKETTASENETAIEEGQEAQFITKYFLGDEVKVKLEEDGTYSLVGSDARLFEDQLSDSPDSYKENLVPDEGLTALALGGGVRKWTNNTIVYRIQGLSSSVLSELQRSFDKWF